MAVKGYDNTDQSVKYAIKQFILLFFPHILKMPSVASIRCVIVSVLQYAVEMEAKLDQLRSLVEAADRDKVELLNQLEEEKRWVV